MDEGNNKIIIKLVYPHNIFVIDTGINNRQMVLLLISVRIDVSPSLPLQSPYLKVFES